MMRNGFFIRAG